MQFLSMYIATKLYSESNESLRICIYTKFNPCMWDIVHTFLLVSLMFIYKTTLFLSPE